MAVEKPLAIEANDRQPGMLPEMSDADRQLVSVIDQRTSDRNLYGTKYHVNRRNLLEIAYFQGFQNTYWDATGNRLRAVPKRAGRARVIDNKILKAVQHATNVLTHNIGFKLRPKGNDFQAEAEAVNGERALWHLYRTKRWARKIRRCRQLCVLNGVGFLRPFFNPNIGPESKIYIDPATREPIPEEMLDPRLKQLLEAQNSYVSIREGDVDLSVHSAFEIYVPDGVLDTDDLPWYVISYRRSLRTIAELYPDRGRLVAPESMSDWENNTFEARVLAMAGGGADANSYLGMMSPSAGQIGLQGEASAFLKIYVETPSATRPKGMFAAIANGVLLERGDAPAATFGWHGTDLFKYDFIERPGSFWPISLVENMISLQRAHNAQTSKQQDVIQSVLRDRVMVARGKALAKSAFSSDSLEIIEHEQNADPRWQPKPDIPAGVFQASDRTAAALADAASQHEAFQGENPPGVRAGVQLNYLRERDLDFYRPIVGGHAETDEQMWAYVHQLVKRTWRTPRYVEQLEGTEAVWAGHIDGSQLAEEARVVIDVDTLMPASRAADQSFALDVLQYGPNLLTLDPHLRAKVLEAIQLGDSSGVLDVFQADLRRAKLNLQMMIEGVDVPVRPQIDDMGVHLQTVRNFQKTPAWDTLPPPAKFRIDRYAAACTQFLVAGLIANQQFAGGNEAQQPGEKKKPEPANAQ